MLILIVGLLFGVGVVYNIFVTGDVPNAIFGSVISIILITTYFVRVVEKKKIAEFINWIKVNRVDIYNGHAYYKGIRIGLDTEVVQYQVCMSFFFISFKIPSGYYIYGYHFTTLIGWIFSLITIIFGWWGIPWGPIYTIQVIINNTKGGSKFKVSSLLPSPDTKQIFKDATPIT